MRTENKITNEVSTTGLAICPVCNHPASWLEGGAVRTSPMVRIQLANLDALIHRCCLHQLYRDIDGQIRIHYRRKFWLNFLPACWQFLRGVGELLSMLFKYGVKDGLAQFNIRRQIRKDVYSLFGYSGTAKAGGKIKIPKRTFKNGGSITFGKGEKSYQSADSGGVNYISGDL